jgi:hypothetical protein
LRDGRLGPSQGRYGRSHARLLGIDRSAKASPALPSATYLTVAPTATNTPTEINTVAPAFSASAWSIRTPPEDRSRTRCFVGPPPPNRSTVALSITLTRGARADWLSAGPPGG